MRKFLANDHKLVLENTEIQILQNLLTSVAKIQFEHYRSEDYKIIFYTIEKKTVENTFIAFFYINIWENL